MIQSQPFHLVQISPWPILGSIWAARIMASTVLWFNVNTSTLIPIPVITRLLIFSNWWRDVTREATYCGFHSSYVQEGLEWGIILFITSEVIFFSAFFWTFYHRSLAPNIETGINWPAPNLTPLAPFSVPLLNTLVLLASGATVTLAHNSLCSHSPSPINKWETQLRLLITILLGLYFTSLQKEEYVSALFTLRDGAFGSVFYVATGFHGAHVIIGSLFLLITIIRAILDQLSSSHHFGFEAAAWYWHFVDVVWIFLYLNLYWWRA